MKIPYLVSLAIVLSLITTSCRGDDGPASDCICTLEYASAMVKLTNSSSSGVDSLQTVSILKRTGKPFIYRQPWQGGYPVEPGRYIVLSDDATQELTMRPDTIIFRATRAGTTIVEQIFTFNTDACRCHIHRNSGPDSIAVH